MTHRCDNNSCCQDYGFISYNNSNHISLINDKRHDASITIATINNFNSSIKNIHCYINGRDKSNHSSCNYTSRSSRNSKAITIYSRTLGENTTDAVFENLEFTIHRHHHHHHHHL
ncbi:hypothetical protein HELRODRAFT_181482 [Helobdella robusta]|uniref:Uncharacterized protein n=1 Tax=Helobdella robusta TaxID=6412 RepID=T1FH17_HELRO|nr:hypothetical protein HELRODRAFT_181482 [Helobdella robusta]ESN92431.1 hypothetical protein HELRODRAFT_181482 [Helobdella robusta]